MTSFGTDWGTDASTSINSFEPLKMIGRVMIGIIMEYGETEMLGFTQPNDVIYRVQVPRTRPGDRELHHYSAGTGPHEGVVERW